MDDEEDTLKLGADAYLAKLLERKSLLQKFLSSLKIAAIAISLVRRPLTNIYSSEYHVQA